MGNPRPPEEGLIEAVISGYSGTDTTLLVPNRGNPVDVLVATILSQASSDVQSARAFKNLKRLFSSWEEVCEADIRLLQEAISVAGLGREKARNIQEALKRIREDMGEIDLWKLSRLEAGEAMKYLVTLPGVGPKTAACTLLFGLGVPVFPVDTHILRISKRVGMVPPGASAEKAQRILDGVIPPEKKMAFHLGLIQHGRKVCKKNKPRCHVCTIARWCTQPGLRTRDVH